MAQMGQWQGACHRLCAKASHLQNSSAHHVSNSHLQNCILTGGDKSQGKTLFLLMSQSLFANGLADQAQQQLYVNLHSAALPKYFIVCKTAGLQRMGAYDPSDVRCLSLLCARRRALPAWALKCAQAEKKSDKMSFPIAIARRCFFANAAAMSAPRCSAPKVRNLIAPPCTCLQSNSTQDSFPSSVETLLAGMYLSHTS